MTLEIFISYSRSNRPQVERLEQILRATGSDAWFDREITAGDEWWQTITDRIRSCHIFVFVLTPQSSTSPYCIQEFNYASALNKPILPIMLAHAQLPVGNLAEIHYVDARDLGSQETALAISRALLRLQQRISNGDFHLPDLLPAVPPTPERPDPLKEIRKQVSNIRDTSQQQLIGSIFEIRQIVQNEPKARSEAGQILRSIVASDHVAQGVAREAREALRDLHPPRRSTHLLWIGVLAILALLAFAVAFALNQSGAGESTPTALALAQDETSSTIRGFGAAVNTIVPTGTDTPTRTARPTATGTTLPTQTRTALPTATGTALPTQTRTALPTQTRTALPTQTRTLRPSRTPIAPTIAPTSVAGRLPSGFTADNLGAITQLPLSPLIGHRADSFITALAFSLDGNALASGGQDQTVRLWSLESGEGNIILTSDQTGATVTALAFSPIGTILAASMYNGDVQVIDTSSRETLFETTRSLNVNDMKFSPDGSLLAVAASDGTVTVWDTDSWSLRITLILSDEKGAWRVVFSPDGSRIAASGTSGIVRVWDVRTFVELDNLIVNDTVDADTTAVQWRILGLTFHPDNRTIAIAPSGDLSSGLIQLWDVRTDSVQEQRGGRGDNLYQSLTYTADGTYLLSTSLNGLLRFWDNNLASAFRIDLREPPYEIDPFIASIQAHALHPTLPIAALGLRSGRVVLLGVPVSG